MTSLKSNFLSDIIFSQRMERCNWKDKMIILYLFYLLIFSEETHAKLILKMGNHKFRENMTFIGPYSPKINVIVWTIIYLYTWRPNTIYTWAFNFYSSVYFFQLFLCFPLILHIFFFVFFCLNLLPICHEFTYILFYLIFIFQFSKLKIFSFHTICKITFFTLLPTSQVFFSTLLLFSSYLFY